MTPGEIAMAIAMGVLLIAGGYAIAYRAGRNREREREPSEAALFAGHADADAVDGERRMLAMLEEAVIVTDSRLSLSSNALSAIFTIGIQSTMSGITAEPLSETHFVSVTASPTLRYSNCAFLQR